MKIIVATNNNGKLIEIKKILKNYEIIGLKEAGIEINVEENKRTFIANALTKARAIAQYIYVENKVSHENAKVSEEDIILADDSGLCIDCLNGFPGVKTHRFLGPDASEDDRNNYIIEKLKNKTEQERKAEVVTEIAIIKNHIYYHSCGELLGRISKEQRGKNGFGFDSIFEIYDDNYVGKYTGKTLAEIPGKEKNRISPRKKAITKLVREKIL